MAGIGIDHSKLPRVKEGAARPARGGGGAGRDGAVWGEWERGRGETVGLGWVFFLNTLLFYNFPAPRRFAALAVAGPAGGDAPCSGPGAGAPGAVPVRGVRRGDGRRRPAAALAGRTESRGRCAGPAPGSPPRASGGGRAGSAASPREKARSGAGGGRSPLSAPGPRPPPPPRSPRWAGGTGLGPRSRGGSSQGTLLDDGRAGMSVCLSPCLSLAVKARPGSEAPLGKMGAELRMSADLAV